MYKQRRCTFCGHPTKKKLKIRHLSNGEAGGLICTECSQELTDGNLFQIPDAAKETAYGARTNTAVTEDRECIYTPDGTWIKSDRKYGGRK